MKTVLLDCANMTSRALAHAYLKQSLSLPDYYGNNLDALFDCLTELGEPTELRFSHLNDLRPLSGYGRALIETFGDAAKENRNLDLVFLDD